MYSSRFGCVASTVCKPVRATPFVSRALVSLVRTKAKFQFLNKNRAYGAPAQARKTEFDFGGLKNFVVEIPPQEPVGRASLPTVVFKFGGSSLGHAQAIRRACEISQETSKTSNVCVVVSALLGVTNKLESACHAAVQGNANEVSRLRNELRQYHVDQIDNLFWNKCDVRDTVVANVDAILHEYFDPFVTKILDAKGLKDNWFLVVSGLGERLSVPIVAAAMTNLTELTAKEIYTEKLIIADSAARNKSGVETDMTRARVRRALLPLLNDGIVPVVSGFIAGTLTGDVVTLGRGGSDLTSTLLADAIDASEVHLWKVESSSLDSGFMRDWKELPDQLKWTGIRTVCPNTVKDSKVVGTMSYEEAAELTHFGKKVLHMATMEPIAEKQIPLFVRNTAIPSHPGTQICVSDKPGVVSAVSAISYLNYKKLHGKKAHLARLFAQVDDLSKGDDYSIVSLIGLRLDKSPQKRMEAILARYAPLSLPLDLLDSVGSSSSVSMVVKNDVVGEAQEALHAAFVQQAFL